MTLDYLKRLTVNQIQQERLPLKAILKDSLYYPACDIDGELIRYCNMHFDRLKICSFVYADYAAGRERLMANLDTFRGYHLVATRQLNPSDVGADKGLPMPEGISPEEYCRYQKDWQPFGQWSVFERDEDCGENHGPLRFSLLYLGAEGAAAYAGLYLNNNITPKCMAIIQPGHGFGLNWTNFTDSNGPLLRTMKMGKSMPQFFFYGGMGYEGYDQLPWPGYERIDRVDHYYPHYPESAMTVFRVLDYQQENDFNKMTYLDYIRNNANRIEVERQNPFTIEDIYGHNKEKLGGIDNAIFQQKLTELSNIPMTRVFVRGSFSQDSYTGFVATMLWGGLGMSNRSQLIDAMTIPVSEIKSKLSNLQKLLDKDRIQDAFMSLQVSGKNKIKGVDISYFTKLLFFLYNGQSSTPPIIFDKWGTYIHIGILISQNEIDLLNTYYRMGYDKHKKFYVAIKSNRSTEYRYLVYADYLQRMAKLSSLYSHSNPGLLEEFLFGKEMRHRENRNDNNPRFFVSNYVKNYYDRLTSTTS